MGKELNENNKAGMHIIRRNVKVINTTGQKSEVEQITTNISGEVRKTHQTVDTQKNSARYDKQGLGVVAPKKTNYNNRSRFGNNRTPVVITRNGKPVEPEKPKEVIKPNTSQEKNERNNVNSNTNTVANKNVASDSFRTQNSNKNYEQRRNTSSNRNTNYSKPFNREDRGNNNRPFNNQNRQNGGVRKPYENRDNTSYQVNKFMKQTSAAPVETKEQREYSSNQIDKKKYESRGNENKKEKLDKNKLREQHSRVATSKLRGMEVDSDSGMLDLYERDTDLSRRRASSQKKKNQKQTLNQTKIIPMTEVKLPEVMTVKFFAEAIKKQASEIIKKLFSLGIMATVNQEIDFDTAFLISQEFGITAKDETKKTKLKTNTFL